MRRCHGHRWGVGFVNVLRLFNVLGGGCSGGLPRSSAGLRGVELCRDCVYGSGWDQTDCCRFLAGYLLTRFTVLLGAKRSGWGALGGVEVGGWYEGWVGRVRGC